MTTAATRGARLARVALETHVNLLLSSASLYRALLTQQGDWRLQDHRFDTDTDEIRISYDVGGSGRLALTVGFELSREEMAALLAAAVPADEDESTTA